MLQTLKAVLKRERGFTLIELLAVMAIVATLAAIVSTSVAGTNESSQDAAARSDAGSFNSSAGDYFADQIAAEELTTSTVTGTATINGLSSEINSAGVDTSGSAQVISSRWPEAYITQDADDPGSSIYSNEFPTADTDTNGIVQNVNFRDKREADGSPGPVIGRHELLEGYTAIDFTLLVGVEGDPAKLGGYAESAADSSTKTSSAKGEDFHNYLWLFRKGTSAGGSGTNDSRTITIFKLTSADTQEFDDTLILNYERIH